MTLNKKLSIAFVCVTFIAISALSALFFTYAMSNSHASPNNALTAPKVLDGDYWKIGKKTVSISSARVHNAEELDRFLKDHPDTCEVKKPTLILVTDDPEKCELFKSDDFFNNNDFGMIYSFEHSGDTITVLDDEIIG
ncbi:MAG: hypothetical protein LBC50_00515 [Candidatus Ancillula sp.]|jgi:hypothetical protein|nr:hypothetical protein [Candidatus Ancillula sp.]